MRGRIGFDSPDGGGTTFYFELPFVAPVTDYDAHVTRNLALVCEDDPDVAKLITRTLEAAGYAVHASPTLERARRLLARHAYRLMTLDLMLADGDGAALIPELRSSEANRSLQVVLISGTAGRLDASALSVADVIRKPFDEGRLIAALGLARAKSEAAPSLLHVEDDPDVRAIVAKMLPESWRVAVADSVASARERLHAEVFDVVLLDLSLPDGSGEDLLTDVGDAAVVLFTAQEVSSDLSARVSAALTKTRSTESELRDKLVGLFRKYGSGPP
jgi:DNA-binding response OmpR family regulator